MVGGGHGCANTFGVTAVPDTVASDGDGVSPEMGTTPDDSDLLAPAGVCTSEAQWFNLLHVLDGDTITIDDGLFSKVRLLGVAAPEIAHPPKPAECFGVQSWLAAKKWLPEESGVKLCVQADLSADDKDKYHRLLRYVYFKDSQGRIVQLNARQIRRGNARLYREFAKGLQLETVFAELEKAAKSEGLGGWTGCGWQPLSP